MWLRRKLKKIIRCVLAAFAERYGLPVAPSQVECRISQGACHLLVKLSNINLKEETKILQSLQEIFDLLSHPRYLLIGAGGGVYAVPRLFAENQDLARCFLRHWRRWSIGTGLVYAHSPEGKRILLEKVSRYLAGKYREESYTKMSWG